MRQQPDNGWIDDFRVWTGLPSGPVYTATPMRAGQPTALLVTDATPSSAAIVAFSLAGNGPIPSPLGGVSLSLPVFLLPTLPTDAAGRAIVPVPAMPASLTGVTIHAQTLDLGGPTLSNPVSMTVL